MSSPGEMLLLPGSHLFDLPHLAHIPARRVFMAEDFGLCKTTRHHQQKIVLFLAAMRRHASLLRSHGYHVDYHPLDLTSGTYEDKLDAVHRREPIRRLHHFAIEDRFFAARISAFCAEHHIEEVVYDSPMFVTPSDFFNEHVRVTRGRPFMKTFYIAQRKRMHLLLDAAGEALGGQWSFDVENRKPLPRDVAFPPPPPWRISPDVEEVIPLVARVFHDHPGSARDFRWPTSHAEAREWLNHVVAHRLPDFGAYEDAMTDADPWVFHSMLTPALNIGLLTPDEVVRAALSRQDDPFVPLASLEGFIRQVIGWREFVRGIDAHFGETQESSNFFNLHGELAECWWDGTTGLPPVDQVIKKALRYGWTHHIERLMVMGSVFLCAGVHPREALRWFMEMYADSAQWVMVPNVMGMSQFADGGIFATKPYLCGSNYLRKMGRFAPGPWCDVLDGLYWSFIDAHREFFLGNHRMSMAVRSLDRMAPARRITLFTAADEFRKRTLF